MIETVSRPCNVAELLARRAADTPDRVAFRFVDRDPATERCLGYQQLHARALAVAAALRARGLSKRPIVVFTGSPESFLVSFLGVLCAGAIAVPLAPPHPHHGVQRLHAVLGNAGASAMIIPESLAPRLDAAWRNGGSPACPRVYTCEQLESEGAAMGANIGHVPSDAGPALLQYTSGSTSTPKAVFISHANLLHNASQIARAMALGPQTSGVSWLPLHHDMGLMTGVIGPLYNGCAMTLMSPQTFASNPATWLQALTRQRATLSGAPNFAYDLCVERVTGAQLETLDLGTLDVLFCGAEAVRPETLERFAAHFAPCGFRRDAFFPCYGLAEATLMVSGGPPGQVPRVLSRSPTDGPSDGRTWVSCGRPLHDIDVVIVDPQSMRRRPDGQTGEIWLRGANVAAGYWHRDADAEAFAARLEGDASRAYLRTGDLGFFSEGELVVCGRIKDLVLIRGANHYPQDIEATVATCHPGLGANAAAAVSFEHEGREALLILQELRRGRQAGVDGAVAAIERAVAAHHGVRPAIVALVRHGAIPRTTSGKIRRSAARDAFFSGELNVIASSGEPRPSIDEREFQR